METEQHRPEGMIRHLAIAFGLALAVYVVLYGCDRHLRVDKGPWQVAFSATNGLPMLVINHGQLGITNVAVVINKEASPASTNVVRFDAVRKPVPFGSVKFEDLTYLPGSVTFDVFGHEVELLPRILILNNREHPWKSGETIQLEPSEKLPPKPPLKRRKSPFG